MPLVETGNREIIASHWWTSPLNHMEDSCSNCHRDLNQTRDRVEGIQGENIASMEELMDKLVEVVEGLALASSTGEIEIIDEIRDLHRQAHIRFDWVFAENSCGFHNYREARELLEQAHEYADLALQKLGN